MFEPIIEDSCLFDQKVVTQWIQNGLETLNYFLRHSLFWMQAFEWVIMQHLLSSQRHKRVEKIFFDHMNESSFTSITLSRDEKRKMLCFGALFFCFTGADATNYMFFMINPYGQLTFYIMCGLYALDLLIMTFVFSRLLYNLRYLSYHNYLLHRKQLWIYFVWFFSNDVFRFLYRLIHLITGSNKVKNDNIANHPDQLYDYC